MAAERGRATARDRAEDGSLLHAQPRMLLDEGVTLRVEDIGHLHRRPAHAGLGFRFSRDRGRTTGAGTCSCSSGFGRGLEMPLREVQIHRRVREVGVAQEQLDRAQVGARFEQVRRVRVPQRVRADAPVDAGPSRGEAHRVPDAPSR